MLLRDSDVVAFSAGGIQVTFKDPQPNFEHRVPLRGRTPEQVLLDEDRGTSSAPIRGFSEIKDGFKHPSLWPGQAGKTLKLNGEFE